MGRWADALAALPAEKASALPHWITDKTAERGVLSVLAAGDRGVAEKCSAVNDPGPNPVPARDLSADERRALSYLDCLHPSIGGLDAAALGMAMQMPAGQVWHLLLRLERRGLVRRRRRWWRATIVGSGIAEDQR